MRFVDFLRAAVLLCAGSATALAAVTVLGGGLERRPATCSCSSSPAGGSSRR